MGAIFLSDIHLKDCDSLKSRLVIRFFQEIASQYGNIYILGDLFDVWPGTSPYLIERFTPILKIFKGLVRDGHQIHYVEGNHDFKLGNYFTDELGIKTYPDFLEEDFAGKKVHMTHGDLGNPKEYGYRALRKILRNDLFQTTLQAVPQKFIFEAGDKFSKFSRKYTSPRPEKLTHVKQVYREAAEKLFQKGADMVLMGHTHIPDDVTSLVGDRYCRYINLGDWVSHFTYLEFDGSHFYTRTHPVKDL